MSVAKVMMIIWAFLLSAFSILGAISRPTTGMLVLAAIAGTFLVCSIGCIKNSRICWVVSLIVSALILARWLPMVAMNTFMAFTGHELYQDSPATFIIVMIYAVIFVMPPTAIFACIAFDWRRFLAVFRFAGTNVSHGTLLETTDNDDNPYRSPNA